MGNQYQTVEKAIRYIRSHTKQQPSLAEVAASVDLSEHHLQRVFTEWAGICPKRFLQYLTKEHTRQALQESKNVLTESMEAGLSSPGRLHDLMITCEAMTPGEIETRGQEINVTYGIADTPFGSALIAWTDRGVCNLAFCAKAGQEEISALSNQWSVALLTQNNDDAAQLSTKIFSSNGKGEKLHLLLRGTNFQIKVWEALLNISSSQLASYSTLAKLAGSPKAQRAVGSALATNKIAYLIPCHRVIRETGDVGVYHWGSDRKAAIQAWEAAKP